MEPKLKAKVAQVIDNFTVVINKGSNDNINPGDKFTIFSQGEMVFDPDTLAPLEEVIIYRGRARVVSIQKSISVLEGYRPNSPLAIMREGVEARHYIRTELVSPSVGDIVERL